MTKIKESSSINQNRSLAGRACPISYVMNKVGGHWKAIILYQLMEGSKRYSELNRAIPDITEKMLSQHLKQMALDGLINRDVVQVMPPITCYKLTPSGERLGPILLAMAEWAADDNEFFADIMKGMPFSKTAL